MTPEELSTRLKMAARRVGPAIAVTTRHEGEMLRALVQANASGRPGPNVITGRYLASWQSTTAVTTFSATTTVGTMAPQARRLEWGFVGADSLGRVYNQPPFPHVGVAVDALSDRYKEAFRKTLEEIFR